MRGFRKLRASLKRRAERLLSVAGGVAKLAGDYRPDIVTLRLVLDPTARPLLSRRYGSAGSAALDRIWERARERCATLSRQSSLGGAIMVRLAAITAAAYETFIAEGAAAEEATRAVYDIAWAVYLKMGTVAWALSAVAGRKNADRLRAATLAFRTFPFSAPSYEWKDVPSPAGVVGFDCRKCPVAEYFGAQQLLELCVRTWCALDFPSARMFGTRSSSDPAVLRAASPTAIFAGAPPLSKASRDVLTEESRESLAGVDSLAGYSRNRTVSEAIRALYDTA